MCQDLLYTVLFFEKFPNLASDIFDLLEIDIIMGTYEMTPSVRVR